MEELLNAIMEQEVMLDVQDGALKVFAKNKNIDPALISKIKENKQELIVFLQKNKKNEMAGGAGESIPNCAPAPSYPLSNAQRRLWVLSQMEGASVAYNMPSSVDLAGEYNMDLFKQAITQLIERHEILRTVFIVNEHGKARQKIRSTADLNFSLTDLDYSGAEDVAAQVQNYIEQDAYQPFDLEKGPLLRGCLFKLAPKQFVFYYNMHHIISDGWSIDVIAKEILTLYQALVQGEIPPLPPLNIQYKDYTGWQETQLQNEKFQKHRNYWLEQLSGEIPLLNLPTKQPREKYKSYDGAELSTYLRPTTRQGLEQWVQQEGGSLFMLLLATWQVMLHKYTAEHDIIIGTPVAGRDHLDLENQIGFYVNTLALRNTINRELSFLELYQEVKKRTLEAYKHQAYPFDNLIEALDLKRDTSRSALFDVLLSLQNIGEKNNSEALTEVDFERLIARPKAVAKFDLTITFEAVNESLYFGITYNATNFSEEMIAQLMRQYIQLLQSIIEQPKQKISKLAVLTTADRNQLLHTFNATIQPLPEEGTVLQGFAKQVLTVPDQVALVFENEKLTYAELDQLTNQLAHFLIKNATLKSEDLVALHIARSEWWIITMLGVLKAGGAYVPIDIEYPAERVAFIKKDSQCKYCLDNTTLEQFKKEQNKYSKATPGIEILSSQLAYVIYTSGTSGTPKGVLVEHKGIYNYLQHQLQFFQFKTPEHILLFSNFVFDASVEQIWLSLLSGSSLHIPALDIIRDTGKMETFLRQQKINHLHATPSYLEIIPCGNYPDLRRVVAGGEKCSLGLAKKWSAEAEFINKYGPTEVSITAVLHRFVKGDSSVPIGRPVWNTNCYILSEVMELQPIGVVGELYLSGVQVARGYLNAPALDQARFMDNPFKSGEPMYRTGDLVKWRTDGTIEYIGRNDDQVKIQGHRIELHEIVTKLKEQPGIQQALVLAQPDQKGAPRLVAYIVSNEKVDLSKIKQQLQQELPLYMIPRQYVMLDEFPLTPNGKVDKRALKIPAVNTEQRTVDYVAARNAKEEQLIQLLAEILDKPIAEIGVYDNFFDLGANSIDVIRIVSELNKIWNSELRVVSIFEYANCNDLLNYIAQENEEEIIEEEPAESIVSEVDDMLDFLD